MYSEHYVCFSLSLFKRACAKLKVIKSKLKHTLWSEYFKDSFASWISKNIFENCVYYIPILNKFKNSGKPCQQSAYWRYHNHPMLLIKYDIYLNLDLASGKGKNPLILLQFTWSYLPAYLSMYLTNKFNTAQIISWGIGKQINTQTNSFSWILDSF